MFSVRRWSGALVAVVAVLAVAAPAHAVDVYGLTSDDHLVRFSTDDPSRLQFDRAFAKYDRPAWTQMHATTLRGIAWGGGELVAIDEYGSMNPIDPNAPHEPSGAGSGGPRGDVRGLATGPDQSSLHVVTGERWYRWPAVSRADGTGGPLSPAGLDLTATAFDGDREYAIDAASDRLLVADAPGVFVPVGPLGVAVTRPSGGFDTFGGRGLLVVGSTLYDVDLRTGAAIAKGTLPLAEGRTVRDLAVVAPAHVITNPYCCGTEGYEGRGVPWVVKLVHRGDPDAPATVTFETVRSTSGDRPAAEPGVDFEPQRGTVTLPPGRSSYDVVIPIIDDDEGEEVEAVTLRLDQGYGPQSKEVLLFDFNDPQFATSAVSAVETTGIVPIEVTRPVSTRPQATTVEVAVEGTATPGVDFVAPPPTLSFAPNDSSKVVPVRLIGDRRRERGETVTLKLNAAGITRQVSARRTATLTIRDAADRTAPRLLSAPRRVRLGRTTALRLRCSEACRATAQLRLSSKRARALGVKTVVSAGRSRLAARPSVRLRLGATALRRLRAEAPERASLRLVLRDAAGNRRAVVRAIRLHR